MSQLLINGPFKYCRHLVLLHVKHMDSNEDAGEITVLT